MIEISQIRKKVLEKEFGEMNDMQRRAVFTTQGPLLILAGAGSGKTTVLINRIANIVRYGEAYSSAKPLELSHAELESCNSYINGGDKLDDSVRAALAVNPCPPWRIMAITFTNKAAGELKERLCNMLGRVGEEIWASTFHSSCARILRRDADKIGYDSHFTIYDTDDSVRLMKICLSDIDISEKTMKPKSVLNEISRAKDLLITPQEYLSSAGDDYFKKIVGNAYALYQKRLEEADAMDFDDLLVNTVRLFRKNPDVLEQYQNRFGYIMVDEYQDTNHAQYEFINMLAKKSRNLCVVGDDDQSIYKFRGATIENILDFEKEYRDARVIKLEQNYRSTQNILDAANAVIENNTQRKGKSLWTDNGAGERIILHTAENEQDEADQIARTILDGVPEGRKFSDYVILYRMNAQSTVLERMLSKHGVPHRIVGGTRFYDRKEIRDMIAYLCVINNPRDEIRLRRIVNTPRRGIGERTIEIVAEIAGSSGETMLEVMSHASDFKPLSRAQGKLKAFSVMMQELVQMHRDGECSVNELYEEILERTQYKQFLRDDDAETAKDKIENVDELSSNIQRFEQENDAAALSDFLEEISLMSDIDNYDSESGAVTLMTVHSAKGLEFPVVFLPGWEEGVFPGAAVLYNPQEIEEERRLAYVAITRAKKRLYIYNAVTRMIFGSTARNRPNRFIGEIPDSVFERTSSSFYSSIPVQTGYIPKFDNKRNNPAQYLNKVKPPAQKQVFSAGDTVSHKTFGQGKVLAATPMANDTLLEITFDEVGTKKLFANFARLTKL